MVESTDAHAFVRNSDVISSETPTSTVALDVRSGDCYAFAGPSARIWELLAQPISAAQTVAVLVREFDIDEDACRNEVVSYFAKLEREGLVKATDAGN